MFSINKGTKNGLPAADFNIDTAEKSSAAGNAQFFATHHKTARTAAVIGYAGQVLSAITEFLLVLNWAGFQPRICLQSVAAVAAGLFAVYLFEVIGVRVFLVRVVRQTIARDFKTPAAVALYAFNVLFLLAIGYASFYTSISFVSNTGDAQAQKVQRVADTLQTLQQQQIALQQQITAKATAEIARIDSLQAVERVQVAATFDAAIKDLRRAKWVQGADRIQIDKQITQQQAEKLAALAAIESKYNARLQPLQQQMQQQVQQVSNAHTAAVAEIQTAATDRAQLVQLFSVYGVQLLVVFMSLAIVSIIYTEIYRHGAQIETELQQVAKRPNLLLVLVQAVGAHLYHFAYKLTARIAPAAVYDYAKFDAQRVAIYPADLRTQQQQQQITPQTPAAAYNSTALQIAQHRKANAPTATNTTANAGADADSSAMRKPFATQRAADVVAVLDKYNISTVASWYKRSSLCKSSTSKTAAAAERNTRNYLQAKQDLQAVGAQIIETPHSVKIKI